MKYCPYCGKQLNDNAKLCVRCGRQIINSQPQKYGTSNNQSQNSGTPNNQSQSSGYQSIQPQNAGPQNNQTKAASSSSKLIPILIIVIIAIVAVLGFFFYKFFLSDGTFGAKSNDSQTTQTSTTDQGKQADDSSQQDDLSSFDKIVKAASTRDKADLSLLSTDISDYPTVRLYYRCEDSDGDPIELIKPSAGIKETISGGDEIERTVRKIEKTNNQGISFDIVTDTSSSMEDSLDEMKNIMYDFVDSMDYKSGDRAELISFNTFVMYMCTYTNDQKMLDNGISNMSTYGDTALYDALIEGIKNAGNRSGAKCVIGFTDGEDNSSQNSPDDVISLANSLGVPVYIIGTGSFDTSALEEIANSTNGRYWDADTINDVGDIFSEIYSGNKSMYCIEYDSDKSAKPTATRSVSCILADDSISAEADDVEFTPSEPLETKSHKSRYEVVKDDVSWTDANRECLEKGGHLVTITSKKEMDKVSKLAQKAGLKFCWIGGYTEVDDNDNVYGTWITGEPFSYQKWYPGEPSRNDMDGTPESYLMMWYLKNKWTWNDQRNDVLSSGLDYFKGNLGYICEYED